MEKYQIQPAVSYNEKVLEALTWIKSVDAHKFQVEDELGVGRNSATQRHAFIIKKPNHT